METSQITKIRFIDELKKRHIALFTSYDIKKIFDIKTENTLNKLLIRLKQDNIIQSLMKNKYLFLYAQHPPSDFAIAQFLFSPSYISLESALSYYGLIDQFPYRISSISLLKSRSIEARSKLFVYSRIKKEYFKDYIKIDDFLIATKEKALFDYLYFTYKGLRSVNMIENIIHHIRKKTASDYFYKNADAQFARFIERYA